jgi:hypothetical protein
MEIHVHFRQNICGNIVFPAVYAYFIFCVGFACGFQQQRTGTAGRVVNSVFAQRIGFDADNLRHNARNLGRCVKLALAFTGFGGEMAHEVFIGIAQQVVAIDAVILKIEFVENSNEFCQPVLAVFTAAEFGFVVKVRRLSGHKEVETVGRREIADDLIDFIADFRVAFQFNDIFETAVFGYTKRVAGFI